ncbi:expressed unknown protein [Seminavis robusta]|uniref:Uncharacterized protein n=1 Tax=Seminavis robusta TaxID=568900 RepID=A0A9N8EBH8_9STRA|nr:expressed unknown protein [Seminavis robusta]|eukprot:Sro850_g210740.1 n/a (88) ;mRNA; r:32640-32903
MNAFLRALLLAMFAMASVKAFAPLSTNAKTGQPATVMHFKFLKDLGMEKPSWLPDFGGNKEEEEPAAEAASTDGEAAEEEAPAAAEE